ncbi:MAG: hypothetical protein NT042_09585 [Sulfuritalea sp.]|nr:hypothetical protein [Sulfuritalea sp.]
MNSTPKTALLSMLLFMSLQGPCSAQNIPPNQARADADLNRQRAESLAVQKKNEQTDKEDRARFEARKKVYEKDERRKEELQKREPKK